MTKLLLKMFIGETDKNEQKRQKCGNLAGIVGIVCNLILFGFKFFAGTVSGSVSIVADAFNNLSDMGSSVVTMLGFKIASKPADPEHPFGHGRMEYMSAALVSALIMLVGFELLTESVGELSSPALPEAGILPVVILTVSILLKLWMSVFNRKVGREIGSAALIATGQDSLNDCISTAAVLAVTVICRAFSHVTAVGYLDAAVGILVALFILYSGFKSLKETLDPLIGLAPDPETVDAIKETVLAEPMFLGIHDMIVHNYGPSRSFASLHVEVPASCDILECHEKIDRCERDIKLKIGIDAVIHMDPIVTDDREVNRVRSEISQAVRDLADGLDIHDFRMVKGENQSNLIFDICVPSDCKMTHSELKEAVAAAAKELDSTYVCVITLDRDFSGGHR